MQYIILILACSMGILILEYASAKQKNKNENI